jgi:hypothetical protein
LTRRRLAALAATTLLPLAACEIRETVLAEPHDIVVAEVFLRAGTTRQTAFLHRTFGTGGGTVPGATIEVRGADGVVLRYAPADGALCVEHWGIGPGVSTGSCYTATAAGSLTIRPGHRYTLRIELADGGVLTGEVTMPGSFQVRAPVPNECSPAPGEPVEILWSSATGTWAYLAEALIHGLPAALAPRGIRVDFSPLRLLGLAISATDTTIVFPTEFGIFDRFEISREVLLALREGLPEGVTAEVVVAATERNFVNWVRGGTFNPSGQVRIPSIRGDGTGVFAGLVERYLVFEPNRMPCRPAAAQAMTGTARSP